MDGVWYCPACEAYWTDEETLPSRLHDLIPYCRRCEGLLSGATQKELLNGWRKEQKAKVKSQCKVSYLRQTNENLSAKIRRMKGDE